VAHGCLEADSSMLVDEGELATRRAAWKPPRPRFSSAAAGYNVPSVMRGRPIRGCDFELPHRGLWQAAGEPDIF